MQETLGQKTCFWKSETHYYYSMLSAYALTCDSDKLAKVLPSGIQRIVHGLYCMASTAWTTMDHLPTAFPD